MKKFTSFQIKLISIILICLVVGVGLLLIILNSKTTISGNININKIEKKDKIYTYDIFSDFYYNITKYDGKGVKIAQFSQLIPTKTSIGYDFNNLKPELIITSSDSLSEMTLSSNNDNELSKEIDVIKNFSKEFGKISAIQDEHYFQESVKNTNKILNRLYGIQNELTQRTLGNFYENDIVTLVSNLTMKIPKLDEINKNINNFEVCKDKDWCPYLVKWSFGEGDSISLSYLARAEYIDLDKFIEETSKNNTVIKMVKINNNLITRFYIVKPDYSNELKSYYMDNNGYVYLLKYAYKNTTSIDKYLNDYIKISYGVSFVDVLVFENKYASLEDDFNKYKNILSDINNLDLKFNEDFIEHFGLKKNILDSSSLKLEDIFNIYEKDSNCFDILSKELEHKKLLEEAVIALQNGIVDAVSKGIQVLYEKPIQLISNTLSKDGMYKNSIIEEKKFKYYSEKLKEICFDINCVKNLKANEWKIEDKK